MENFESASNYKVKKKKARKKTEKCESIHDENTTRNEGAEKHPIGIQMGAHRFGSSLTEPRNNPPKCLAIQLKFILAGRSITARKQ